MKILTGREFALSIMTEYVVLRDREQTLIVFLIKIHIFCSCTIDMTTLQATVAQLSKQPNQDKTLTPCIVWLLLMQLQEKKLKLSLENN